MFRASVRCRVCPAVRNCPLQMWMVRNPTRQAGQSLRNQPVGFVGSDRALHLHSSEQGRACGEPAAPAGWPVSQDHTSPGLRTTLAQRVLSLSRQGGGVSSPVPGPCGSRAALPTLPWAVGICLYVPSARREPCFS